MKQYFYVIENLQTGEYFQYDRTWSKPSGWQLSSEVYVEVDLEQAHKSMRKILNHSFDESLKLAVRKVRSKGFDILLDEHEIKSIFKEIGSQLNNLHQAESEQDYVDFLNVRTPLLHLIRRLELYYRSEGERDLQFTCGTIGDMIQFSSWEVLQKPEVISVLQEELNLVQNNTPNNTIDIRLRLEEQGCSSLPY